MKQSRFELLKEIYNEAVEFNTMESGLTIPFEADWIDVLDFEYLEGKGYITTSESRDKTEWYANITADGMDIVENEMKHIEIEKRLVELTLDGRKIGEASFKTIDAELGKQVRARGL